MGSTNNKECTKIINQWILNAILKNTQLCFDCRSVTYEHRLQLTISQVPQQFQPFCQNIEELYNMVRDAEGLSISGPDLVFPYKLGQKDKKIGIKMALINLPLGQIIQNKDKIIEDEQQKYDQLMKKLQEEEQRLKIQKKEVKKLRQQYERNINMYVQCSNGCGYLIPKNSIRFYGALGPLCWKQCKKI